MRDGGNHQWKLTPRDNPGQDVSWRLTGRLDDGMGPTMSSSSLLSSSVSVEYIADSS